MDEARNGGALELLALYLTKFWVSSSLRGGTRVLLAIWVDGTMLVDIEMATPGSSFTFSRMTGGSTVVGDVGP